MEVALHYDVEWLTILRKTHSFLATSPTRVPLPSPIDPITTSVGSMMLQL